MRADRPVLLKLGLLFWLLPAWAAGQSATDQQISMLKGLIPSIRTVTVVCNVAEVQPILRDLKAATESRGLGLSVFDVKTFPELYKVFRPFTSKTVDVIWMVPDSISGDKFGRRFLQENCIRKKIPLHAYSKEVLREGALLYMSVEDNPPVYYINKAAADLMGFIPPPEMQSKVTNLQ